MYLFKKVL